MTAVNIIWIYCDQLRTDALSCYEPPVAAIRTPAIDALAERGVRFANCFCNSPICVPSRTSTLTANYPERTGVFGNEGAWRSYPYDRDLPTFPGWLARSGYRTVNIGKTHVPRALNPWNECDRRGAELGRFFDGLDRESMDIVTTPTMKSPLAGRFPADRPFPGEIVTNNAIAWLRNLGQNPRPFLMRIGYLQPHTPVTPPPPFDGLYADIDWPRTLDMDRRTSVFERRLGEIQKGDALASEEIARVHAEYHRLVAWVDAQVGRVLEAVAALGLRERTVIVFESDHGVALGESGCFAKQSFAPEIHRVPRIISWPGTLPEGQTREDINESLDLARTVCGLAGIEPAEEFKGRDLFAQPEPDAVFGSIGYGQPSSRALPNNEVGDWVDGTGWPRRGCIRTNRFRLDMNVRKDGKEPRPEDEDIFLVDVLEDPGERRNRADNEALVAMRDDLRARLLEHCRDACEPPFVPAFSVAERGTD